MNSGVAQEALPQDGSHGKHRKTQVKAVVWQGMGVGQAPHAGDSFRGRDSGLGNRGLHTDLLPVWRSNLIKQGKKMV